MFVYDIDVRTGDSHSVTSADDVARLNRAKNVSIGDHVWVASHMIILKGSVINKNSVIATGSVVKKATYHSGVVIGGNPARVIKKNITWVRERV